jgi:alpha-ribazole phosphatase
MGDERKRCELESLMRKTITTIGLLRHGETVGSPRFCGAMDDPLTELGWAQLREAVKREGVEWQRVISSPLSRCADFARDLGEQLALPVALDERLREMHFGDWEGRSAAELMTTDAEALSLFWDDPVSNTPAGAEPLLVFQARVLAAWRDILARHPGERILLLSHGGVVRTLLCHLREHPVARLLEFDVRHASMHRVEVIDADGSVHYSLTPEPVCFAPS